jgi:hypothetical protein
MPRDADRERLFSIPHQHEPIVSSRRVDRHVLLLHVSKHSIGVPLERRCVAATAWVDGADDVPGSQFVFAAGRHLHRGTAATPPRQLMHATEHADAQSL